MRAQRAPKRIWNRRTRLLALAFAVALGVTGLFATRFVAHSIYWSQHRDEPIESWMTIGYVANSYEVDIAALRQAVGLPPYQRDRHTLAEIARAQGRDFEELRLALVSAIVVERNGQAQPLPNADRAMP